MDALKWPILLISPPPRWLLTLDLVNIQNTHRTDTNKQQNKKQTTLPPKNNMNKNGQRGNGIEDLQMADTWKCGQYHSPSGSMVHVIVHEIGTWRYSTSLIIWEIQMKTTMEYLFTAVIEWR